MALLCQVIKSWDNSQWKHLLLLQKPRGCRRVIIPSSSAWSHWSVWRLGALHCLLLLELVVVVWVFLLFASSVSHVCSLTSCDSEVTCYRCLVKWWIHRLNLQPGSIEQWKIFFFFWSSLCSEETLCFWRAFKGELKMWPEFKLLNFLWKIVPCS